LERSLRRNRTIKRLNKTPQRRYFYALNFGGGNMPDQEVARLQEQIKTLFGDVNELKEGEY
jgi:hypothetical protein